MAAASFLNRTRKPINALEAEREDFIKSQNAAVTKAINQQECAVKEKHLRTALLGSHLEKGAGTFWDNACRLPLEGNPIIAWKFNHVFHKLMREGHSHVLTDSCKYKTKIGDLGRLWGHLKDGYGRLIKHYCKLNLTKLEFHQRNPNIPGNLVLTDKELDSLGEKDVNNWFEMAIEMLDYQDEILALQKSVFNSMDMSRANSLTSSGQCRLAPLILAIQDSSCLYDYVVKMMFKLHACLPPDTLGGHRDRFNGQFKQLKQFYYTSSNLQYFKHLVSIPSLPEEPPNFLIASDFDNYVTPQVLVHGQAAPSETGSETPPDAQSLDFTLVDVTPQPPVQRPSVSPTPFHNGDVSEKDQIITSLRHDLDDNRTALNRLQAEYQMNVDQLQNRLLQLDHALSASKDVIDQLSEENDRYRSQAEELQNEKNQQTAAKLEESEKKAQSSEEKFRKMKDVYGKLREEHIELLRKQGTLQQDVEKTKMALMDTEDRARLIEQERANWEMERRRVDEHTQQTASDHQNLQEQLHLKTLEVQDVRKKLEEEQGRLRAELESMEKETAQLRVQETTLTAEVAACHRSLIDRFGTCCQACIKLIEDTLELFENPAHLTVTCSPEFVLSCASLALESLEELSGALASTAETPSPHLFSSTISASHSLCDLLLHSKATANAAPTDAMQELTNLIKRLGTNGTTSLTHLSDKNTWTSVPNDLSALKSDVEQLEEVLKQLLGRMSDVSSEELGDMLEKEMKSMDKAIQNASSKIQELISQRRDQDTGVRLEVNEKILDACTALMKAVTMLVQNARTLQAEIVGEGRGTGSSQDFYKRHHKWTEGLLSAAKSVGLGAHVLVGAADRVVRGEGKFEELMAASQEVAASTAQLIVASKVKASRGSDRLSAVTRSGKSVSTATAAVIGTVKSGQETLADHESLDFSHLSFHKSKRLEMETQVRVLELETLVEKERVKLGELRKQHYQMEETTDDD